MKFHNPIEVAETKSDIPLALAMFAVVVAAVLAVATFGGLALLFWSVVAVSVVRVLYAIFKGR